MQIKDIQILFLNMIPVLIIVISFQNFLINSVPLPSTSNSSSQMDTSNSTLRKAAPIGYPKFNIVSINLQIGNFTSMLHTKTSIKHGI